jgi:hypothetical protein
MGREAEIGRFSPFIIKLLSVGVLAIVTIASIVESFRRAARQIDRFKEIA